MERSSVDLFRCFSNVFWIPTRSRHNKARPFDDLAPTSKSLGSTCPKEETPVILVFRKLSITQKHEYQLGMWVFIHVWLIRYSFHHQETRTFYERQFISKRNEKRSDRLTFCLERMTNPSMLLIRVWFRSKQFETEIRAQNKYGSTFSWCHTEFRFRIPPLPCVTKSVLTEILHQFHQ